MVSLIEPPLCSEQTLSCPTAKLAQSPPPPILLTPKGINAVGGERRAVRSPVANDGLSGIQEWGEFLRVRCQKSRRTFSTSLPTDPHIWFNRVCYWDLSVCDPIPESESGEIWGPFRHFRGMGVPTAEPYLFQQ